MKRAILTGRLKAGDRLPSERELVEMFQASRGSLREALRVLEQKGLIHIRVGAGGGAVVRSLGTRQVSESLGFLIRYEKITLEELTEFRERVEGDAAALAARRATKAELDLLDSALQTARACVKKGESAWEDFLRADERFHVAMVTSSHNRIYYSVLKMVQDNIHQLYLGTPLRTLDMMRENLDDLTGIFEAIREKKTNGGQGRGPRPHSQVQHIYDSAPGRRRAPAGQDRVIHVLVQAAAEAANPWRKEVTENENTRLH